jgi:ABC-2 type transport system permease protein
VSTAETEARSRSRVDGALRSVYRAELRKLTTQLSTRALILVCALGPFAFGAILSLQSGVPADTLLGVWVHSSGYAVSFVVLGFADFLGFPVLAGVLAGDSFSSEDRYGTWKTVLTRSRSRFQLFAGKLLALSLLAVAMLSVIALASLLAGLLFTGGQPLVGLGGTVLSSGAVFRLEVISWLVSIPPLLAFVSMAVLFSIATRNGIVGVLGPVIVGFVMQLLVLVGTGSLMHTALVANAFDDWNGLLAAPRFYGPLIIGTCVSLLWLAACLIASWLILRKRDFAGPPLARRAGWVIPARAVLAAVALVVLLGAAGGLGPAAATRTRLQASIAPIFSDLTVLQQSELGRHLPRGTKLDLRPSCFRHAAKSEGPGDDWSCTLVVIKPQLGSEPFQLTPVTYDVSVKSNGCYKAQAPPSFVGQQTMTDIHHRSVVNPLFTIYGCFDTIGSTPRTGTQGAAQSPAGGSHKPFSKAERESLQQAERAAGPKVIHEIQQAEAQGKHEAESPTEEAPAPSPAG